MRNKLIILFAFVALSPSMSSAQDSSIAIPTSHTDPLGISDTSGLALYLIAVIFLVLMLGLWRQSKMKSGS